MIPLAKDTREAIGAFADKVENRSLLFEKMVLAKSWGHPPEVTRLEAGQPNVLRACTDGDKVLRQIANDHRPKNRYQAKVAGALVSVSQLVNNKALAERQSQNSLQLLSLLEKSYAGRSHTFVGELAGRMLINMAGGVQENAGLALDRCFGLPYIPGSAAKGVTRNAALWDIRRTTDPAEKKRKLRLALLCFGFIGQDIHKGDFVWAAGGNAKLVGEAGAPFTHQDSFKGLLSFLPAYPATSPVLVAEVLTPHPRASQAAEGRGDPRPIFFPAVEAGSSFAFAIILSWMPDGIDAQEVLDQAGAWLRVAITVQGVGAKTGAGYGWFVIDPKAEEDRRTKMAAMANEAETRAKQAAREAAAKAAEDTRIASLAPEELELEKIGKLGPQAFTDFAKVLPEKTELEQRAFLKAVMAPGRKEDRKRWKKNKPDIWNPIVETAGKLGIPLE